MPKISCVIITYNEEKNIERCLNSIKDLADEIIVVDSYSTDNTEEICKKFNVKFLKHKFETYKQQKNWGHSQTSNNYILSLDADEVLSDELKKSILEVKENWTHDIYYFNRLANYCGKWIKHCGWYPDRKIRLFDKTKGKWIGGNVHEKFMPYKNTTKKFLRGNLLHYTFHTIEEHINQINKFSTLSAFEKYKAGKKTNFFKIFFIPIVKFFIMYFLKLGILDGYYGLIISLNSAYANFLKHIKLRELYKRNP